MTPCPYRDRERQRVQLLELRRKIDKMICDLVDQEDEERIRSIKGRAHQTNRLILPPPADSLPEEPDALEAEHSGGPERHI